MAKNKHKHEATTQENAAQTSAEDVKSETVEAQVETVAHKASEKVAEVAERAEAAAEKAAGKVAEKVAEVTERAEAAAEKAAETVESVAQKASEKVAQAAEAAKTEAARAETVVSETAGQVATFVKGRLEQAQRQITQLEEEAQKALNTLVSKSRESGREVLQRFNVNELRELPTVQNLRERANWVGGEVRQRLTGLRGRMVQVVGGVASQSQVDALNRELDRLSSKLDSLVSPKAAETEQQQSPKA